MSDEDYEDDENFGSDEDGKDDDDGKDREDDQGGVDDEDEEDQLGFRPVPCRATKCGSTTSCACPSSLLGLFSILATKFSLASVRA
jgi:hypothetical protein